MDRKRRVYQKLWAPKAIDRAGAVDLFREIKQAAQLEPMGSITAAGIYRASGKMKPRAGLGVD
eukprot:2730164-Pyramimonas_sp.AAC.1